MTQKTATFARISRGVLCTFILCMMAFPATAIERQYKIEAAFLYNFFNYITWPGYDAPQALKEPVICVYGSDPIIDYLGYVREKMAAVRPITIRSVFNEGQAKGCDLLFMRHNTSSNLLKSLSNTTLTVFKSDDPLDRGGMIELTDDEEHIAIHIDQTEMEHKGFKTSSRLLTLAKSR